MGLGIKTALQIGIAKQRHSPVVRALHNVTSWFEQSFDNEGSDFNVNGECALIHRLSRADFRLIFDVGANIGEWAEHALVSWPNAHIHAFEVAPQTADAFDAHMVKLGQRHRVETHRVGASDAPGTLRMYYFPSNPQMTCDTPRHEDIESIPFDAEMVTLDDFADKRGIDAIDFLKIDVEGAEHRVLDGFKKHLAANTIKAVQFEYGPFVMDSRVLLKDFYDRLSANYWIGKIYPNGVDFTDYNWQQEGYRFANYFCVSKSQPAIRDMANRG